MYRIMLGIIPFLEQLPTSEFCRQSAQKSDTYAKPTKLPRDRNGIPAQQMLSQLVNGEKEANRNSLDFKNLFICNLVGVRDGAWAGEQMHQD